MVLVGKVNKITGEGRGGECTARFPNITLRNFAHLKFRTAHCAKHGRLCSVENKIADLHLAGTTCTGFSTIGSGQGEAAESHGHFICWAGQRAVLQEPLLVQENATTFPREALTTTLPMYDWIASNLSPDNLGWPIRRERQYMV